MARPLRIEFEGAFYHVISRGNERKPIFGSSGDSERFLSYLDSAHGRYGAAIHVYCLMDTHYHLFFETPRGNLSQILHHINVAYTTYVNLSYIHISGGRGLHQEDKEEVSEWKESGHEECACGQKAAERSVPGGD